MLETGSKVFQLHAQPSGSAGIIGRGVLPVITRAAGLALALALGGCATLPPPSHAPNGAKPSRAEHVFRYQSRVADALLDRYPLFSIFDDADPALVDAEAHMTKTCSPLTRAVLAEIEGERPSLGLRFQVFTSLDDCERAARRIERLLDVQSADRGRGSQSI